MSPVARARCFREESGGRWEAEDGVVVADAKWSKRDTGSSSSSSSCGRDASDDGRGRVGSMKPVSGSRISKLGSVGNGSSDGDDHQMGCIRMGDVCVHRTEPWMAVGDRGMVGKGHWLGCWGTTGVRSTEIVRVATLDREERPQTADNLMTSSGWVWSCSDSGS